MKNRAAFLYVAATLATVGYMAKLVYRDTLPKAADRMGKAILSNDTKTIWQMVPDSERALYGFDQTKFETFWMKIVRPHLKGLNQYQIESENDNGLNVVCKSSSAGDQGPHFSLLVSGQLGNYYSPYIVGYACLGSVNLDYESAYVRKSEIFARYVRWIDQNQALLTSIGITKIKRGPAFSPESFDEMKQKFQKITTEEKKLENSRQNVAIR